ncbi:MULTISPECIES: macrolide family glycosyltransferase [unclassified Bacillus (in: firmicutes)]|uniref:macrolide family glycosyltransferase n=1 Tax=unclassified Bacillus (in: firmicutes) TaxID=185979 RepID=UPI0008E4E8D5|nr:MULTISPECIES: macrolide family glycosyltransferase [unclassified Bacillus (in: firmicutes)]SFI70940.1 glycosyltransferase, MGT family [Bacillus sp. 71mf]SFS89304.1 glycosyltransferase, MGT family [Bacillus sp. 103mf]
MKKALYINIGEEGHVNPTLGLVRDLVKRGDHIVYYSSNHFEEKIKKTGAQFRAIDQEAQRKLTENMSLMASQPKEYLLHFLNAMEMITDSILEKISKETYDYIIYDAQSLPGKWVAHHRGLVSIATWTTFAFSQELKENMNLTGPKNIEQKRERLAILQAFLQLEEIAKRKQYLEEKYEVPLSDNFLLCPGSGNLNIVFTSCYFQRNSKDFKDGYIFVGPSIAESETLNDFPVDELKGRCVIYISMGTIINNQPEFYQKCFAALKDFNAKVILSIGKQLTAEQLGDIPDNFIVRNYLPQLDILRQTDVFISHCGMNSTSESLYFEVPLVMLPFINDQHTIAERVHELGAGFMLNIQQLSAADLKHAVNEVLQHSIYKENAKEISQSFREAGGYIKAADEIITFTR